MLAPLIPAAKPEGRPPTWSRHRIIDGIFYHARPRPRVGATLKERSPATLVAALPPRAVVGERGVIHRSLVSRTMGISRSVFS